MLRLYDYLPSGNGYKIRLLLSHLELAYKWVEIDILRGKSRLDSFLQKNPNGRIPVLEINQDHYLAESNAILCYLARGTKFLPDGPLEQAKTLQWLFFEQYSHEPYIATSRYWRTILQQADQRQEALLAKQAPGYAALEVMEQHLSKHPYLVAGRFSIADIALYAYTHVADEGGFSLQSFPAIRDWLERISSHCMHVLIDTSP